MGVKEVKRVVSAGVYALTYVHTYVHTNAVPVTHCTRSHITSHPSHTLTLGLVELILQGDECPPPLLVIARDRVWSRNIQCKVPPDKVVQHLLHLHCTHVVHTVPTDLVVGEAKRGKGREREGVKVVLNVA